jgi:mono/diheme cytochrome c family protein
MRALLAILALALAGGVQAAGNAQAGKAKAAEVYLVRALTDYKTGARTNPIMKGFATTLSRQDIENLAAWFASQKSPLHDQR